MDESLVEKLDDEFLGNAVGGVGLEDVTAGVACLLLLASFGCSIASCAHFTKSEKAKNAGNCSEYYRCLAKAKNFGISTAALLGATILDIIVCATSGDRAKNARVK